MFVEQADGIHAQKEHVAGSQWDFCREKFALSKAPDERAHGFVLCADVFEGGKVQNADSRIFC